MERSSNQETEPPPAAGVSVPADPTAEPRPQTPPFRVVSGKGRGPYQSKGNQFLRHLAKEALPRYQEAQTNREKIQITTALVDEIQATGGEFWDPDHQAPLTNEDARIKVGQLIRYLLKRERVAASAPAISSDSSDLQQNQHERPFEGEEEEDSVVADLYML